MAEGKARANRHGFEDRNQGEPPLWQQIPRKQRLPLTDFSPPGNPARAFGPELIASSWDDFWIWYVGPMAGGAIAALLYDELYLRPMEPVSVGPPATGVVEPGPGASAREP